MPRAGRSRRNSHARDGSRASVSRARARDARGDSPDGCAVTVGCLSPLTPGNCASRTAEPGLDSPARGRAREGRRDSSTNQDSRRCSVRGEMSGRGGANGSKGPGASGQHRWRTWQSDEDIPQRKELIQHMCVRRPSTAETRKNARSWVAGFRASFARPERARLECMEFIADLALFFTRAD